MEIEKLNCSTAFENRINHPFADKISFSSMKYLLKFGYKWLSKG